MTSCSNKEQKPYGAVDIEYGKVEEANDEGPVTNEIHDENVPPMASISANAVEKGPERNIEEEIVEPTADMDDEPDFGGIPVVTRERTN